MNQIEQTLSKRFERHRVIFWYDEKQDMAESFQEVALEGVEKIEVNGNEFEIKHIITKQKPDSKFLVFIPGPKPANDDNWLLDLELAYHVFHTDQEAIILQELGLDYHFKELVTEHLAFFKSKERINRLRELLGSGDEHEEIRAKMLAVVFNTDFVSLITFIQAHATAFTNGDVRIDKELATFNLKPHYWGQIQKQFNYQCEEPSIYDFLLDVFNASFAPGGSKKLNKESRLLLSLWKDTLNYRDSFGVISDKIAEDLGIESKLNKASLDEIIQDDLFNLTDKKIIYELVNLISEEAISNEKVFQYTKQRENKYWYNQSSSLYKALENASEMMALVRKYGDSTYSDLSDGVKAYTTVLYQIDAAYRKFVYYFRLSHQNRILAQLAEKVERVYSNDWLLTFNDHWQEVINATKPWPVNELNSQKQFFAQHVSTFTEKNNRLYVVISDAFRYECGVELLKRIQSENRFEASINYLVASLPSYTQLGMASLLPNSDLAFQEGTDTVLVNGGSSAGTANRAKLLNQLAGVRATAILAEEFMNMNASTEGREFSKQYDLIYIYHNRIDKVGDDKASEEKVFEAVEEEMAFLINVLKKIANMNGNNMIITSDHGFLYQHQALDESDFSDSTHTGDIWKDSRRFVIGRNLKHDNATVTFSATELGLGGEAEVLLPKSINRLRVKGAGSRFIHGGSSLQEIVIPLITVSKVRQDTTSQVEIDIIKSNDRITTNLLTVSFIQQNLVTASTQPRTIRAALFAEDGEVLSDRFTYHFDIEEGSERQREVKHKFQLSSKASGKYKHQRVKLLLEEPVDGSSKWKEYKRFMYTLNISFSNDFDD